MLDTSYMLPVFGVDVGIDSAASIQATLSRLVAKGTELYISDLSPFEAFIKSYRIAEKIRDERGKEEAKLGLLFVAKGGWATRIDHNDDEIIEEAFKVRLKHNDLSTASSSPRRRSAIFPWSLRMILPRISSVTGSS